MKTIYHPFLTILFLLMGVSLSAQGPFQCVTDLDIVLGPGDTYTLFPEDLLLAGDLAGLTAEVQPSVLDCSNIGTEEVNLYIYDGADLIHTCQVPIQVTETMPPVVVCETGLAVSLDANGEYAFAIAELDEGSYDNCSALTFAIDPPVIHCGSPNPTTIVLTATDASGNASSCFLLVEWSPYPDPAQNLACNAEVLILLGEGQADTIEPFDILEGGPYGCPAQYTVTLTVNGVPRPEPIVTLADTSTMIIAAVTDTETGVTCWGLLDVAFDQACAPPFTICDTECHSAPLGDCASGHTDTDMIEWPCDLQVEGDCESFSFNPTPENLLAAGVDPADVAPVIVNEACYLTSITYTDQVFMLQGLNRIERTWLILYWPTGETWSYVQELEVSLPFAIICDTLPWTATAGDCASGHTFDDAVEWPADITVSTLFVTPADLLANPDVADEDAQPRLFDPCGTFLSTYFDLYTVVNDTTLLITRTWGVFDPDTGNEWIYEQAITVYGIGSASLVCTTRESSEPIAGVTLIPGITTGEEGCYSFSDPAGVVVAPYKDDPLEAGVNLLDKLLMMEHILGITQLSPFQVKAADLSLNGIVSTLDAVYIDKILDGTFVPTFPHNWRFFEQITMAESADISNPFVPYRFIGVKMGDVDNSFVLSATGGLPETGLVIRDEILNAGETYGVPVMLDGNYRLNGVTIALAIDPSAGEILSVEAPQLPDFSMDEHVTIEPGRVTIDYLAPSAYFVAGVPVASTMPFLQIRLRAGQNTILNEELGLDGSRDNLLREAGTDIPVSLNVAWEEVIISSVITAGEARQLSFYPNPVTDRIRLAGLDAADTGRIHVVDVTGRVVFRDMLRETVDLSGLTTGTYYLTVEFADGSRGSGVMYKM
jgi:hypothetical protein